MCAFRLYWRESVLTRSRYIFRYSELSGFCKVTDIASRGSIDVALASLASAGKIRRIRRGLSAGAPGYQTTVGRRDPATARSGVSKALENEGSKEAGRNIK